LAPSPKHIELTKRSLIWLDTIVTQRGLRGTVELTLGNGYVADAGAVAGLQYKWSQKLLNGATHTKTDDFSFIFETKVSRADFNNTFRHCNHIGDRLKPRANFHFIVTAKCVLPTHLDDELANQDVPSFWGFLEESNRGLRVVKLPTYCPHSLEHLHEFAYRVLRYSKTGKFNGWDLFNELRKMSKYGNSAHPLEDELIEKCKEESKLWRDPSCFMGGTGFGASVFGKLSIEGYKSRLKERVKEERDFLNGPTNDMDRGARSAYSSVLDLIDSTE
jgi:hypothetical protein